MTKISYSSLKLKTNTEVNTFDFNGNTIEVLKYLPFEDKYDLINITMQEAREGSLYNAIKLDMFFHLNLVFAYTNLSFTEKQKEDLEKIYNILASNGFIDKMVEAIPDDEYNFLYETLENTIADTLNYKTTITGLVQDVIDMLPSKAEEMQKIIDNFDPSQFQAVLDFAKNANLGRDI